MLGGDFPKSSGVAGQAAEQHPGELITAAAASAQRIQGFGPEVGRRARRSWPRLGGVDVTGNLSARPAERDVRGPGGAPRDSAAAGRHRGCHDRRDGGQLARVGRAAPSSRTGLASGTRSQRLRGSRSWTWRLRWSPGRIGTWRPGTRPRRRAVASPARGQRGSRTCRRRGSSATARRRRALTA